MGCRCVLRPQGQNIPEEMTSRTRENIGRTGFLILLKIEGHSRNHDESSRSKFARRHVLYAATNVFVEILGNNSLGD